MKKELEVKILEIDEPRMRAQLADLGARLEFDGALRTASYEFSMVERTQLYLTNEGDGRGLLAFPDAQRGRHLHTAVTDYTETAEILAMIGLENRGEMWRVPRKLKRLDEQGYRLRLRRLVDQGRCLDFGQLTLKTGKEIDTIKRMDEYETDVADYPTTREILLHFGMREYRAYEKMRAEYHLRGGVKVVVDNIPQIPTFIEIEGPDDESIERTVGLFGYTMADTCTSTGREVRAHYNR